MNIKPTSAAVILILCLSLRLLFFMAVKPWNEQIESQTILQFDAGGYHAIARTLLESGQFAHTPHSAPDGLRTPLYPYLVASVYSLFGQKPWIVLLIQILIDTITCFILGATIASLLGRRTAFGASVFYALNPFLILYCSTLLSDTLFVFLLVCSFYFFSIAYKSDSKRNALYHYGLHAAVLGVATLVRPISIYIPLFLVCFFTIAYWKKWQQVVKYSAISAIAFCIVLSPWLIRNYATFGTLSISTSGPYNILMQIALYMEMNRLGKDQESVTNMLLQDVDSTIVNDGLDPRQINEFELANYYKRVGIKIITEHPIQFVKTYSKGVAFIFTNLGTSAFSELLSHPVQRLDKCAYNSLSDFITAFLKSKGTLGVMLGGIVLCYLIPTYLLTIVGFAFSLKHMETGLLVYLLLMICYFILTTGAAGLCRFQLPLMPFYFCFTGAGCDIVYKRVQTYFCSHNLAEAA